MTHQQETDWSKVPKGTLVEVRCQDNERWLHAYWKSLDIEKEFPYLAQVYGKVYPIWNKQCRLYETPGVLVWRDWNGGECPVPEGKWCVVETHGDGCSLAECPRLDCDWEHVTVDRPVIKYCIIDPPPGGRDE